MNMLLFGLLGLIACGDKEDNTEDTSNNGNNTDTAENPDVEEEVVSSCVSPWVPLTMKVYSCAPLLSSALRY